MKMKLFLVLLWITRCDPVPAQNLYFDLPANLRLSWIAVPDTDCVGYKAYCNGKETITTETSVLYLGVTDTSLFWVRAFDRSGNISGASEVVWAYPKFVTPDTIPVPPIVIDTIPPSVPQLPKVEIVYGDTSFMWSAKDLIQFGGSGVYSDYGNLGRYGLYSPLLIPIDIDKAGVYKLTVNVSGKGGTPVLSVNEITIGEIELNKIKPYVIRLNLQKGNQILTFSSTASLWFFGQAIVLEKE